MRKSSAILSPLFSDTLQGVLAAITLEPGRSWYLSDLASHLEVRPSTLQRTLNSLARSGILVRTKNGNRVYYQADPHCPILPELRGMMAKTVGIIPVLREVLWPLHAEIGVAFLHGSVAEGREDSESDIDLVIVGSVRPSQIALAIRPARDRLARQVAPIVYAESEFAQKASRGQHFVTAIMKKPKVFLIGSEHDLVRIAGESTSRGREVVEAGSR